MASYEKETRASSLPSYLVKFYKRNFRWTGALMHGRPLRREFVCIDCGPPSALGIETINTPLLNSLYIPFKSDSRVPALKIQFKRVRINARRETTSVRERYSQRSSGTVCRSRDDSTEQRGWFSSWIKICRRTTKENFCRRGVTLFFSNRIKMLIQSVKWKRGKKKG